VSVLPSLSISQENNYPAASPSKISFSTRTAVYLYLTLQQEREFNFL
jgi:hypothetical protein